MATGSWLVLHEASQTYVNEPPIAKRDTAKALAKALEPLADWTLPREALASPDLHKLCWDLSRAYKAQEIADREAKLEARKKAKEDAA